MNLPRWRLFPKYATLIITVVASVLGASSAVSLVFSWREIRSHLVALQAEKAQGAATRIEQYILDIEHQLGWTAFPRLDTAGDALEQRRIEYLKLQRQVPAVTELVWIGADGRERLRVSRLAMDAVNAGTDLSKEPAFIAARGGKTWFGPVQFRKGTEPYMAIARPAGGDGGVTVADVNLKFVWDVVSRIKIGAMGLAYVVDATGTLIAHPDISLVLKKTDLKPLPQVAAALDPATALAVDAHDLSGQEVLAATARIPALNWTVFVESPRKEAFAPLYTSIVRLALLLIGGLLLAAAASFFLARALVRPIRALQEGAARIGAGELGQRIDVKSGDELEDLAERFNHMSAELQASYADLERKVEERTRELSDTLEQQTATAEILKVISASPTDVQPVFEAIVESCQRLCGGKSVNLLLASGGMVERVASASEGDVTGGANVTQWPLDHDSVSGDCILRSTVVAVPDRDAVSDTYPRTRDLATAIGWRSAVFVPLLRDGKAIGCIGILRSQPGTFDAKEVALAQVFADQAVIAIENVRLFNETKEALEQQTATSEVLRVISRSVADTKPVFDAILHACERLFDGLHMGITLLGDDGAIHLAAHHGPAADREAFERTFPVPLSHDSGSGAAILARKVMHYPDVEHGADVPQFVRRSALPVQTHAVIFAPLLWEERGIGTVFVGRRDARAFSDKEIEILRTFADQAVIAIQNARLFNEIKDALEQQTATAEVLQVISNSVADAQPVFQKILQSCRRLFGGEATAASSIVLIGDDDRYHMVDYLGPRRETMLKQFPRSRADTPAAELAIRERRVLRIADVLHGPDTPESKSIRAVMQNIGAATFTLAMAPMLWKDQGIGVISAMRDVSAPFTDKEVALLKTFADQAAIAIQNARLFNETKEALEQQTATAEVLRVISSSVADTAPVFDKILESCSRLFESSEQGITLLGNDGLLHLGAHRGAARERLEAMFPVPVGTGPESLAMTEQRVLHYPDVLSDAPPGSRSQQVAAALGGRTYSQVFVPLRWEGRGVGYLYVTRRPPAPFSDKEIDLLKTFADQAVIAIQNARLFHALEDKSRQLEAANRHKSEFLANMSHELRTPLNAIIGFSEVLTEQMFGELNDKQMEYLKDIHSSGQHLLSLINDVLDLSKIEAGKMELDLSCFDLGLLLEHSATLVRERAQRHGLTLELEVDAGLDEWVADARKVKQIVVNLLSNAVKFTPNGGRVSVRARRLNGVDGRAGEWAEVSVSDTGVGIAAEEQALVFEEFRQAGGDVLRKAEGTGLGLALVKRFVELHGGALSLDSEVGRGSTFRFVLPQHEVKVLQ